MEPPSTHLLDPGLRPFRFPKRTLTFLKLAADFKCGWISRQLLELSIDAQKPAFVSAFAGFLSSSEIIEQCRTWGACDPVFLDLAALSEALWLSPEVRKEVQSIDYSVALRTLFRGDFTKHYLPTTLAAPRLVGRDHVLSAWLEALRLWLLRVAIDANQDGFPDEQSLLQVCREVRSCLIDKDTDKVRSFARLAFEPIPATADGFEQTLKAKCSILLANPSPANSKYEIGISTDLLKLFERKWADAKGERDTAPLRLNDTSRFTAVNQAPISNLRPIPQSFNDEIDTAEFTSSTGIKTVIAVAGVDESQTPAEQEIEASHVSLLSREDSQMLPWSWHRTSEVERRELLELTEKLAQQKDIVSRLGASLIAISTISGCSGGLVASVEIRETTNANWSLDPQSFQLARLPPRRPNGWTPSTSEIDVGKFHDWLKPVVNEWRIDLATVHVSALKKALASAPTCKTLGELWSSVIGTTTFEQWINSELSVAPVLSRLSSPILGAILRQDVFTETGDATFARLLTAFSSTALPAPCAYAGYDGRSVKAGFSGLPASIGSLTDTPLLDSNWAGSQLDVLESHLVTQISNLKLRIDAAAKSPGNWIDYHNLLVTYVILALFATTGARPARSPFESLRWFDLKRGLVFVDDKFGGPNGSARLCLLTGVSKHLMEETYLPYLRELANRTRQSSAKFAEGIDAALNHATGAPLPLFFFLSNDPKFEWIEVSEQGLSVLCGETDWPLPFNFFRHRLSTGLRRRGLDPEIIDALLGHAEADSETHGAYSLRTLNQDLEVARPLVEEMMASLSWKIPQTAEVNISALKQLNESTLFGVTRKFGVRARAVARKLGHGLAYERAIQDIHAALGNRKPQILTNSDWDEIALAMILRPDGMPHSMGTLRYDAFEKYLRTLWEKDGIRPQLKKRYLLSRSSPPILNEKVISAPRVIEMAKEKFAELCQAISDQVVRPQLAAALAAMDACLIAHVADPKVLLAIATHSHLKLIHFDGRSYIEHYEGDRWTDEMPRRRFEISSRCCKWIQIALREKKAIKTLPKCPDKLRPVADLLNLPADADIGTVLSKLAGSVGQHNNVYLSGLHAAVMDGRIHISALPHFDLVRAVKGIAAATEDGLPSQEEGSRVGADAFLPRSAEAPEGAERALACRRLFKSVRKALTSIGSKSKKQDDIQEAIAQSGFKNSDLPFAVAAWTSYLLTRPSRTKTGKLTDSSVVVYSSSIASRVAAVGYADSLGDLDEDELVGLYGKLLEVRSTNINEQDESTQTEVDNWDEDDSPSIAHHGPGSEVHEHLVDFHQWAKITYGLDDPDWSELDGFTSMPVGRPGYIRKSEYLWALRKLLGAVANPNSTATAIGDAFVLLLGYRFGLRSREAMGTFRRDWIDVNGAIVVLVRPNELRGLKTLQSKRQIPKVEPFTPLEKSLVQEVLRRCDARAGTTTTTPILAALTKENFKTFRMAMSVRLLRLLKEATKNPSTTIHHLRHSFACRMMATVAGSSFLLGSDTEVSSASCEAVRRLLLGRTNLDRRALWAVCRLLGHSSPATLLKAYFHGQFTCVFQHDEPLEEDALIDPRILNLDLVAPVDGYLEPTGIDSTSEDQPVQRSITLDSKVNYLRLRTFGYDIDRAAFTVDLPLGDAKHLEEYLGAAAKLLESSHPDDPPLLTAMDFCKRIGRNRWGILRSRAKSKSGRDILLTGAVDRAGTEVVGRSRQLVLFRSTHLRTFEDFVTDLDFSKADLRIISPSILAPDFARDARSGPLRGYLESSFPRNSKERQVNLVTAPILPGEVHGQRVKFVDRVAAIVKDGGAVENNYELILLWVCWASGSAPNEATD
ncbi:MAG: hypothetical protein IPG23_16995 [Burkholderiales bacterium]|nr:hypothetical protein [Burkholderiales bacterium]